MTTLYRRHKPSLELVDSIYYKFKIIKFNNKYSEKKTSGFIRTVRSLNEIKLNMAWYLFGQKTRCSTFLLLYFFFN